MPRRLQRWPTAWDRNKSKLWPTSICRYSTLSTASSAAFCPRERAIATADGRAKNIASNYAITPGEATPVMADVGCRNTVFGAEAQEAERAPGTVAARRAYRHFRLEFVHESAEEVKAVTQLFQRALNGAISFAELNRELKAIAPAGTTQGSLFVPANYLTLPVLRQPADLPR